ncbi:MAG: hypothetical protein M1832_005320 [Thelocarpon impressellum]|nr:MAG: hypothetical protein M1832_005320 [Thelocarpon impressellum]
MAEHNVVVLGAGVVGLTTALVLSRRPGFQVTVIAKHMPGDYDVEYASPWAGANYFPLSVTGPDAGRWNKETYPELVRLARELPEAGIHFQDAVVCYREKDVGTPAAAFLTEDAWFKESVPDLRELPVSELPPGVDSAIRFTSVCMNTALYLPWLVSQCLKNGVVLRRDAVAHVCDATKLHHSRRPAELVLNCTGLLASRLGGVEDRTVFPVRGQTVLVRNDPGGVMYTTSGTDDGDDELLYIMQRAAGGGTILGGSYQKNNWDPQPDPHLAARIMARAVALCPALTRGRGVEALDVVRHGVGLRPYRAGGIRLERETIGGVEVVHNYGHGGYGYQSSYGCAYAAVRLVEEALRGPRSKL